MRLMRLVGLVLALLAAPLAAETQPAKVPRIGVLLVSYPERSQALFREGLRDLGYVEGQNILVEYRSATALQTDRLADFATELVRLKVDVIVAQFSSSAQAAQRATADIPIVMAPAGDPVGTGLVASLARPGGNLTGVSGVAAELARKHVQLIREVVPSTRRVVALCNLTDPFRNRFLSKSSLGLGPWVFAFSRLWWVGVWTWMPPSHE
jgi:putative ABC transport system substrate-binding protein